MEGDIKWRLDMIENLNNNIRKLKSSADYNESKYKQSMVIKYSNKIKRLSYKIHQFMDTQLHN